MYRARHLGGNGSQRLALEIGVVAIPGNVALVFGSEAVVALPDGHVGGHPKGASQPSVAELGKHGATAELPRLMRGEIEAAKLQELPMMSEAAQITVKYGTKLTYDHERAMMKASLPLLQPDAQPVGWMDAANWSATQKLLVDAGFQIEVLPTANGVAQHAAELHQLYQLGISRGVSLLSEVA